MQQSKEDTAALWLHNKLGSSTHLWSFSSTVVSQYNLEKLQSIRDCFTTIDSLVKFKFFLSLFHIPKRNLEEFKPIIQEIIENTIQTCLDQWVLSIATFVQSYWLTQSLNTEADYDLESFDESYNDLIKAFRNCVESQAGCERVKFLLPIECDYLNKNARMSILPQNHCLFNDILIQSMASYQSLDENSSLLSGHLTSSHQSKTHFSIVKHPKSVSLIDDLRNKAVNFSKSRTAKSLMSTSGSSIGNDDDIGLNSSTSSKSFPFVNRFSSKKIESIAALSNNNFNSPDSYTSKIFSNSGISSLNKGGSSSFFKHSMISNLSSSTTITGKSSTIKRDIGIKLLDASEQSATPKEAKRKRKEQEKEALKKQKQEQKQIEKEQISKSAAKIEHHTSSTESDPSKSSHQQEEANALHNTSTENVNNISLENANISGSNMRDEYSALNQSANQQYQQQHSNGTQLYPNVSLTSNNNDSSNTFDTLNGSINRSSNHHHTLAPQISSLSDLFPSNQSQASMLLLPTFSLSAPHIDNQNSNANNNQSYPNNPTSSMNLNSMYHQQHLQQQQQQNMHHNSAIETHNPQFDHRHQQQQQQHLYQQQQQALAGHAQQSHYGSTSQNVNSQLPSNQNLPHSYDNRIQQQQQKQQQQPQQSQQTPSLTLTREQMLQAQEMFSNSNKLTRPEKALILGFIAGSRDNPRPEEGSIVSIKLNEVEEVLTASNGQQHRVLSELFFQMNYDTGEYKKILYILLVGLRLCMTQLDEQFKEGIFENSEFIYLKRLIDVLNYPSTSEPVVTPVEKSPFKKETSSFSPSSKSVSAADDERQHKPFPVTTAPEHVNNNNNNKLVRDEFENDDEDIVLVDGGDSDFDRAESQDEDNFEDHDHDDNDDVVVLDGQTRRATSAHTLTSEAPKTRSQKLTVSFVETEPAENSPLLIEIEHLEKFKSLYQAEYRLSESRVQKYFEKIFSLIVSRRICSKSWTAQTACHSNKNVYLVLYALRILLRDVYYQRKFLAIESSFSSIAKLFNRYVSTYSSAHSQILIHSHILDQLLNILAKILFSEPLLAELELFRQGSGTSRHSSANSAGSATAATTQNEANIVKKLSKRFFGYRLHVHLMQLIENSNELCLVQASLNLLVQIASIDTENRARLAADLDISEQLLIILQEYDEDSKKFAAKLLCLLCIEDKIKSEVTSLDGIQVLLSLLHSQSNLDIVWNVIWCLVQLCSFDDNKREIRLMGGIPLVLSVLCDKSMDFSQSSELPSVACNGNNDSSGDSGSLSGNKMTNSSSSNDLETNDKRLKAKLQVQAACCALVGELAFNETNSYHIVNTNGVYLVANKLLIPSQLSISSGGGMNDSTGSRSGEFERNKDVERLHCNVWRTLRLLFSTERHRSLLKKLIPFSLFEQFVDIGNYKKDLKLYQPLVDSFYKLNKDEAKTLRQQVQSSNHVQAPKNYINEYEVYEIIGSGAFGRVHKVKKKNSSILLAMKEISTCSLKGMSLGDIVNEVTIIRNNLKHPNIVRYLKTFKENDNLYIVMELIDGTPLSQHLRTLKEKQELWPEEKIWNLFIQIVLALKYLHKEKQIVHRDLTSNNIMLGESDRITITDFGLAKLVENDCGKMLSVVGTMFYSCPEIIKNEPYNEKADIWALGCIMFEMCCHEPPFCTSNMLALATKITQADYDQDRVVRNGYSPLVSLVLSNCLVVDPIRRCDIIGIAAFIAEKILTYTDHIRYKCASLERKLEKEKNKTQKLYCNKQDLSLYQRVKTASEVNTHEPEEMAVTAVANRNSSTNVSPVASAGQNSRIASIPKPPPVSSATSQQEIEQQKNNSAKTLRSNSTNSSSGSSVASILIPVGQKSGKETAVEKEPELTMKQEALIIDALSNSPSFSARQHSSTCSPNAKLPPLRHPKSKLIIKNMQNKQKQIESEQLHQQQQKQQNEIESQPKQPSSSKPTTCNLSSDEQLAANVCIAAESANEEAREKPNGANVNTGSRIQRSSSSSVLEKRSSQSKKSRPNSANSGMAPVYKKLRPVQDPILQILDQIHKILFIAQLPPSGKKNFKRKLVDRYKRSLFSNKRGSIQIKAELMKLIKNSNELIDIEMIGLKNFQYCFNSSDCNSLNNNQTSFKLLAANASNKSLSTTTVTDNNYAASSSIDLEVILNQNGITYEQMQIIIEDLLVENNYHLENIKNLREELPPFY